MSDDKFLGRLILLRISKLALACFCLAPFAAFPTVVAGNATNSAVMIGDVAVSRALFNSPGNFERKVAVCAQCHGAKGEGNAKFDTPALNSSSARYIAKELVNYRTKKREQPEMNEMASLLSDGDIRAISQYYGSTR